MKKLLSLVLIAVLLLVPFTACQSPAPETPSTPPEDVTVRVAGMKGPTSMGLVKLAKDAEKGETENKYQVDMTFGKADAILPKLLQGEFDMAALPANVAASVYNSSNGKVRVLAINTLGVVNIVERGNTIDSFDDLVGKKIYAVGKSTTPEYVLRYLLAENGVDFDSLNIEWRNEATEILPLLKAEAGSIAMIPQPFVTAAQAQIADLRIALDFNGEWARVAADGANGASNVTGVLVARTDFATQYPNTVATFLSEYKASIEYAQSHVDEAAALVVEYGILAAVPIAKAALPKCALSYIDGAAMKTALSFYLEKLYEIAPASIGGKLPEDAFYYVPTVD